MFILFIAPKHFNSIWFSNLSNLSVLDEDSNLSVLDEDPNLSVLDEDSNLNVLDEDSNLSVLDADYSRSPLYAPGLISTFCLDNFSWIFTRDNLYYQVRSAIRYSIVDFSFVNSVTLY